MATSVWYSSFTGNDRVDPLIYGVRWGGKTAGPVTITYSFAGYNSLFSTDPTTGYGPASGDGLPFNGFAQLNSLQRDNVRLALAEWSKVSGVTFKEVADDYLGHGTIRFGFSEGVSEGSSSGMTTNVLAYSPGKNEPAGDVWLNADLKSHSFAAGTFDYTLLLRGIGFALGLNRPDRANPPLDIELDNLTNTVTSNAQEALEHFPVTPMALDVAAIQALYGFNPKTLGNNRYTLDVTSWDYRFIADAGGTDTLAMTNGSSATQYFDLGAGFAKISPAKPGNVVLYGYEKPVPDYVALMVSGKTSGAVPLDSNLNVGFVPGSIENVDAGGNTIFGLGSSKDNVFSGVMGGSINGGGGTDRVIVDTTFSAANFTTGTAIFVGKPVYSVTVQPAAGVLFSTTNIEIFQFTDVTIFYQGSKDSTLKMGTNRTDVVDMLGGTEAADFIYGLAGRDTLIGRGGNDTLNGGAGGDRLLGGDGIDTASYFGAKAGVKVSLANPSVNTGDAAGDTYSSIENIVGTRYNDVLIGDGKNNTLTGGGGRDIFVFNETLNGKTNVDRIKDFDVATDTIHLENAVMKALKAGNLSASAFWKSKAGVAHDADDRIIYDTDSGNLYYDSNGDKPGGAVLFAKLDPKLALTHADFVVI